MTAWHVIIGLLDAALIIAGLPNVIIMINEGCFKAALIPGVMVLIGFIQLTFISRGIMWAAIGMLGIEVIAGAIIAVMMYKDSTGTVQ